MRFAEEEELTQPWGPHQAPPDGDDNEADEEAASMREREDKREREERRERTEKEKERKREGKRVLTGS